MITIRKFRPEDALTVYRYSSDFENTYYMLNNPFSSLEEASAFVEKCIKAYEKNPMPYLSFAVLSDDTHIGEVFASLSEKEADLGWIIDKNYWGRGYATEAARLLMAYLENTLGIREFVAYCDARNIASQKVMKHLGMHYAGSNGIRTYEKEVSDGEELIYRK